MKDSVMEQVLSWHMMRKIWFLLHSGKQTLQIQFMWLGTTTLSFLSQTFGIVMRLGCYKLHVQGKETFIAPRFPNFNPKFKLLAQILKFLYPLSKT